MSQFALPLAWPDDARDAEFLIGESNAAAVRVLEHWATWPVRTALLVGPPGSGRSLLGRVFAARNGGEVIDDADRAREDVLFHAWNRAQEGAHPLLMIARAAPPEWPVALPDLRSRLAASPLAVIGPPDDALLAALIERAFERRRVDARPDLVSWLSTRVERSHAAVTEAVDRLVEAALSEHRRLSISLARATLGGDASSSEQGDHE